MAIQQGLFTQGPSVQDILAKRNQRQFDLQQQLMQQAAQGARDPAKMRAVSLLGSSLGRALGGAMGGGDDSEVEKRKAAIAEQESLRGQYAEALTQGTPEQQMQLAGELIKLGLPEGGQLLQVAQQGLEAKKDNELAAQKKLEDNLALSVSNEELQERSSEIGKAILKSSPNLAELLMSGGATEDLYKEGIKALDAQEGTGSGNGGTTSMENAAAYKTKRLELEGMLAEGDINQSQFNIRNSRASSMFGGGVDQRLGAQATQDAKGLQKALDKSQDSIKGVSRKIAQYNQSLAILDTGVFVGTGANLVQGVRSMAVAMGVANEDTVIDEANYSRFQSLAIDAAMDYIEQTKGAVSDKEMLLYAKASQGTDKSPEANRIILKTAKRAAQWRKNKDLALNTWVSINKDKFPSSADLKVFEAKWEKANELDLTDDIARLEEINKTPALTSEEVNKLTDAEAIQAVRDITEQK